MKAKEKWIPYLELILSIPLHTAQPWRGTQCRQRDCWSRHWSSRRSGRRIAFDSTAYRCWYHYRDASEIDIFHIDNAPVFYQCGTASHSTFRTSGTKRPLFPQLWGRAPIWWFFTKMLFFCFRFEYDKTEAESTFRMVIKRKGVPGKSTLLITSPKAIAYKFISINCGVNLHYIEFNNYYSILQINQKVSHTLTPGIFG